MKQFLMGDKIMEMTTILTLKEHMFRPMNYQSPIEGNFYLSRTLGDLLDRHYSLFAQNQHPLQLAIYEEHNKFLRSVHDPAELKKLQSTGDRIEEITKSRNSTISTEEGESLSINDFQEIYIQAMGEKREQEKFKVRTRDRTGEINDYLEVRRPFGAAQ